MTDTPLLNIRQLCKRYPGAAQLALDNVSLTVPAGIVYGFLGANGAGKSTTIRTILNFIQPTSGTITVAGYDTCAQGIAARREIGYLAGDVALYNKVTGAALLQYMAALQPLKHPAYCRSLTDRLDVPLNQPIGTLSKGNRQKLGLIQALMHEPAVLVLDEPTSGLDPLIQEVFFTLVREAKERGAAIFLSSHNLAEVQRICDRVGIIKHGKLVREQSITELLALDAPSYTLRVSTPADLEKLAKEKILIITQRLNRTTATIRPRSTLQATFAALGHYPIQSFTNTHADLEDEFLKYYEDDV